MATPQAMTTAPAPLAVAPKTSDELFPHQEALGPLPLPELADSARSPEGTENNIWQTITCVTTNR